MAYYFYLFIYYYFFQSNIVYKISHFWNFSFWLAKLVSRIINIAISGALYNISVFLVNFNIFFYYFNEIYAKIYFEINYVVKIITFFCKWSFVSNKIILLEFYQIEIKCLLFNTFSNNRLYSFQYIFTKLRNLFLWLWYFQLKHMILIVFSFIWIAF